MGYGGGLMSICFWSSLHLLRIGYVTYLIMFVCMDYVKSLIIGLGILRSFSCVMQCLYTTPRMLAKIVILGD